MFGGVSLLAYDRQAEGEQPQQWTRLCTRKRHVEKDAKLTKSCGLKENAQTAKNLTQGSLAINHGLLRAG